jgi:hypothetical protein
VRAVNAMRSPPSLFPCFPLLSVRVWEADLSSGGKSRSGRGLLERGRWSSAAGDRDDKWLAGLHRDDAFHLGEELAHGALHPAVEGCL